MHLLFFDPEAAVAPIKLDGDTVFERLPQEADIPPSRIAEHGLPYVLSHTGEPQEYLHKFFLYLRSDGASLRTVASYARDVLVFSRYLAQTRSKSLLECTNADVGEYRILRLEGPSEFRLKGSSWRRTSVALTRFYQWAADEEVGLIKRSPKTWFRRDGVHNDASIKFVPLATYLQFRTHLADRTTSGLRNSAFAELLINSGLRVQEANSLLTSDIPFSGGDGFSTKRIVLLHLPETITKGRKARDVPYSRRVARQYIEPYLREERAAAVERWRSSGGIHKFDRPLLGWPTGDGRIAVRGQRHAKRSDSFSIADRRRLFLVPHEGASPTLAAPAMLWLTPQGDPCTEACWSSTFRRASDTLSLGISGTSISPHTLRHTFAVQWLSKLVKLQVSGVEPSSELNSRLLRAYRKVAMDPLRTLQRWMGHSSYLTTQIYLNYIDDVVEDIELAAELIELSLTIKPQESDIA